VTHGVIIKVLNLFNVTDGMSEEAADEDLNASRVKHVLGEVRTENGSERHSAAFTHNKTNNQCLGKTNWPNSHITISST
jgi:hypothetical protein